MYKVLNLFGEEETILEHGLKHKKNLFSDYSGFVDKFELKKTTDDCYTPDDVYDLVIQYVNEKVNLTGRQIIRPFYPGGNFEAIDYPKGCIVIDNPPFSIITNICKFYISQGIDFFLFAPHMTLFGSNINCTKLVVGADIIYENGAKVKTSFLTNIFSDEIIGDADLYQRFKRLNQLKKVNLPKYIYPANVLTVWMVSWIVERGISISFDKNDLAFCRSLDSQKVQKKSIFGSGFLISEKAAAEKAAAEKAAAENAAAENDNVIIWALSENELNIIKSLGKNII